ncbi:hypothetical protein AKO1_008355 [Acrasis kona]|uniref:Nucleotidyltransferase n=1 Tax=Acrasis kona TaxID=1008807 RepID=A0AAW2YNT6_9EUKA
MNIHNKQNDSAACLEAITNLINDEQSIYHNKLMVVTLGGSRLYNTALTESNDVDINAIYICDTEDILGIDEMRKKHFVQSISNTSDKNRLEGVDDFVVYELSRFVHLLITGNPSPIDILFGCKDSLHVTLDSTSETEWSEIFKIRNQFLTKELVKNMVGYAKSQMNVAIKRKEQQDHVHSIKSLYHGVRILMEASRILDGNEPCIRFQQDDPNLTKILKIRSGSLCFEQGRDLYQDLSEQIKNKSCILPDVVSDETKQWLHDWMIRLRLSRLRYKPANKSN